MNHPIDRHAFSTDNPETVAAYRQAIADRKAYEERVSSELEAMGAGPHVYLYNPAFAGPEKLVAIGQKGDFIPDGWQLVRRRRLEPCRGQPGEPARRWLAEHQPPDVLCVLEKHGLPRASRIPGGMLGWRAAQPELFEHDGTLWACYMTEPGASGRGFDRNRCTWTPRKLSEFYAAYEAMQAAAEAATTGAAQ
jgi:hypothetical protein